MSVIELANTEVSILEVCRQINLEVPDEVLLGRSVKVMCPQGDVTHPDGGIDPAFRIYPDTNTAWCFVCQQLFTPVTLYVAAHGGTREEAAQQLLKVIGFSITALQDFGRLTVEKQPDSASLAEALKIWCSRICTDWETRQFDANVSGILNKCLALLTQVRNTEDAAKWLRVSKQVMGTILAP